MRSAMIAGQSVPESSAPRPATLGSAAGRKGWCSTAWRRSAGVSGRVGSGVGGKRRGQILVGDVSGLDLFAIPVPRHRHRGAGDAGQKRGRAGQRLARLAQIRVDRNRCIQRPGRRNGARRGLDCIHDPFADRLVHGVLFDRIHLYFPVLTRNGVSTSRPTGDWSRR